MQIRLLKPENYPFYRGHGFYIADVATDIGTAMVSAGLATSTLTGLPSGAPTITLTAEQVAGLSAELSEDDNFSVVDSLPPASANGGRPSLRQIGGLIHVSNSQKWHPLISPYTNRPKGRAFGGNYGRRVTAWESALSSSAGTAALVTPTEMPPIAEGQTQVLRLDHNATQSYGQKLTITADYTPAAKNSTSVGIWVNNPTSKSLGVLVTLFNAAANHQLKATLTVEPTNGWKFLTVAGHQIANASLAWVFNTDAVHIVRVGQNNASGEWAAGDYMLFGTVYVESKGRPRFMIGNDDGTSTIYRPFSTTDVTPSSGRSYREIVEHYGFKGTLYIIPSLIGTAGYLTQRELLELYDSGWAIGSHSWTHPAYSSRGLTSLGPIGYADVSDTYHAQATNDDTAIYADVMRGIEELGKLGISSPENLFSLPQGAWDSYVRSAVMRSGVKHVRGISGYQDCHTISIGLPSGDTDGLGTKAPGGWIHQYDAVQSDGAVTVANIQTYIDDIIAYGSTGANYHHATTTTNGEVLDGMCSYLKTKADLGLIEVVTAEQAAYDDGLI